MRAMCSLLLLSAMATAQLCGTGHHYPPGGEVQDVTVSVSLFYGLGQEGPGCSCLEADVCIGGIGWCGGLVLKPVVVKAGGLVLWQGSTTTANGVTISVSVLTGHDEGPSVGVSWDAGVALGYGSATLP